MLRRIRLKNFVHFDEEQDIMFQQGPSFCIGQNGSGKSSLLEAIRRCMSTSKNMEMSRNHNDKLPSIAMCYFDFHENDVQTDGATRTPKGTVISAVVYLPVSGDVRIKLVFVEAWKEIFLDVYRISTEGFVVNEKVTLSRSKADALKTLLTRETVNLGEIFQTLKGVTDSRNLGTRYTEDTDCERFLRTFLDKTVVITSSMRSITAFQWTNSKKLIPNNRLLARTEVQDRAEILAWYLDPENDALKHQESVKRYFDIITDNCNVCFFRQDDGKIFAREGQDTTRILGIEKIPEGFFEAMNCAIILAYPAFKTVCLEEPGRGMHPQMVERLRDLVLKSIDDKTVLITSHKPAFVTSWNIPKMLFFKKIRAGKEPVRLKVILGENLAHESPETAEGPDAGDRQQEPDKIMRITTTRHFTTLYFARRVLLVEGDGDLLFLSEMKSIILKEKSHSLVKDAMESALIQESITASNGELVNLVEDFRRFLWPLHILGLNGEPNKSKLEQVCSKLEIERYFVLDFDAITDDQQTDSDGPTFRHFLQAFNLKYTNNNGQLVQITGNDIRQNEECLENVGIFVWNRKRLAEGRRGKGTIEIALKGLCGFPQSSLGRLLNSNRVTFQWDDSKKEKHRNKLFVHRQLSDGNIRVVVREVLKNCQISRPNEIFRLLVFLCKMFLKQQPRQESGVLYSRPSTSR